MATKVHSLDRHQHAGILVPVQQRILSVPCLSIFNVCPAINKILVAHDLRQLSGNGTVYVLNNVKVGREEDIEISLVDLVLSAAITLRRINGRERNSQKV